MTDIEEDDYDDDCPECGSYMQWIECHQCGGEGGRNGEDLMSEDPLWYSPDDFEVCDICNGKTGWYACSNAKNHKELSVTIKPNNKTETNGKKIN